MELSRGSTYLSTIEQLSQKNPDIPAVTQSNTSIPLLLAVTLICTFIALFIAAKIKLIKQSISTLILIGFAISIPFVATSLQHGLGTKTKAGPSTTPKNIQIIQITKHSVRIVWTTEAPTTSGLRYNDTFVFGSRTNTTLHAITLSNLAVGVVYTIEILSGSMWYNNNGSPIQFILR